MIIAFDISPLSNANKNRGVGFYTQSLLDAYDKNSCGHTIVQFTNVKQLRGPIHLIHYPYFDTFYQSLPIIKKYPQVVTVHDLTPIVHMKHFAVGVRGMWNWIVQRESLRHTSHVITDSLASKSDIVRYAGISESKITSIPLAPRHSALPVKSVHRRKDPFILYVGDVNWNKNIIGLLKAFALYKKKSPDTVSLILVGESFLKDISETREIHKTISELGIKRWIEMTGFITDEALGSLYSQALVYVQPSFYEGFGFPLLEAMSLGCPVVTADKGSLSEISGPSIKVDPLSPESIQRGISLVVDMSSMKRRSLQLRGKKWAHQFTWQKTALATIKVYENSIDHHSSI